MFCSTGVRAREGENGEDTGASMATIPTVKLDANLAVQTAQIFSTGVTLTRKTSIWRAYLASSSEERTCPGRSWGQGVDQARAGQAVQGHPQGPRVANLSKALRGDRQRLQAPHELEE